MSGFSSFEGEFVHAKGHVKNHIANFAAVYVLFGYLWICLTDISSAKRSLVIGEFNQCEQGRIVSKHGIVTEVEFNITNIGTRRTVFLDQGFEPLKLLSKHLLIPF